MYDIGVIVALLVPVILSLFFPITTVNLIIILAAYIPMTLILKVLND